MIKTADENERTNLKTYYEVFEEQIPPETVSKLTRILRLRDNIMWSMPGETYFLQLPNRHLAVRDFQKSAQHTADTMPKCRNCG